MKVSDILKVNNYKVWVNKIIDENGLVDPEQQKRNIRAEYKLEGLTWQQMMTLIVSVDSTYLPQRSWLA